MFLYNIFILPLLLVLEIIIHIMQPVLFLNPIIAIFYVSLFVNFITHPIFAKVEQLCQKDNDEYKKLLPRITQIKKNFKAQEQRMLLQTYFRQNKYHPLLAHFRQSLTIFLQVPIFIASYQAITANPLFVSQTMEQINNSLFLFGFPIHILPLLMTAINVVSISFYMKGKSLTSKLYMGILPAVFLILLYSADASIVLYWIFNNIFSLLRNTFFYIKENVKCYLVAAIILIGLLIIFNPFSPNVSSCLLGLLPLIDIIIAYILWKRIRNDIFYLCLLLSALTIGTVMQIMGMGAETQYLEILLLFTAGYLCYKIFVSPNQITISGTQYGICALAAVVIFYFYLPLKIINSSPQEFYSYIHPIELVYSELSIALGLFFFYPLMFFLLLKNHRKPIWYLSLVAFFISLAEFHIFTLNNDILQPNLEFSTLTTFTYSIQERLFELLINIGIILGVALVLRFKLMKYVKLFISALLVVYLFLGIRELHSLYTEDAVLENKVKENIKFEISKNGKNVVILFLDRAYAGFLPLIKEEKPELIANFTGFAYYPRTVSLAVQTLYSTPSLLGGYEYTPQKLQNDTQRRAVDKHNEAISVLPEIFRRHNYDVILSDIPYINYDNRKEPPLYHKDIRVIDSIRTKINENENVSFKMKKKLFFFIFFRLAPKTYKNNIYYMMRATDISLAATAQKEYLNFENFIKNTKITEKENGTFTVFISILPHQPVTVTEDYEITEDKALFSKQQKKNFNAETQLHYNVNMLSYMEVSKYITKLKENGVYDNTKIIIMSDHAWSLTGVNNIDEKIVYNNSLLMVKDYNATGELKTDWDFMTSADVPFMAVSGTIENPSNPFTGKTISTEEKQSGINVITSTLPEWAPGHYHDKNRTYLYKGQINYMHIDKENIKNLIKKVN